jgi:hypothetical protein
MATTKRIHSALFSSLALVALTTGAAQPQETAMTNRSQTAQAQQTVPHPYIGMWVTADGRIRHELLPNGRYDEQRGTRKSAYQGRYTVTGSHIDYVDDTGFSADGEFVSEDVLHHGGMVFHRER